MVRDLEAAGDLLADSDLVAAIAGDPVAQQLVSAAPDADEPPRTDDPEDDYSVLDADSSQRSAIDDSARRPQPGDPRPAWHGQEPDDREPDRGDGGRAAARCCSSRRNGPRSTPCCPGSSAWASASWCSTSTRATRDRQRIAAGLGATLDLAEHADRAGHDGAAPAADRPAAAAAAARGRAAPGARAVAAVGLPGAVGAARRAAGRRGSPPGCPIPNRSRPSSPRRSATSCASSPASAASRCTPAAPPGSAPPCAPAPRRTRPSSWRAPCPPGRCRGWLPGWPPRAGKPVCPPACASYPERTRLTRLFNLLHEADQPGRGFRERRALRKEAQAEWTALAGGRRTWRRTAAAVGLPGAGPRVAGSRTAAGRAGGVRTASRARRGPGEGVGRAGGGRGNPVAAAPAARAGPPLRRPRPRPAARRGRLRPGHPRRARGRVRLRVVPHDPGPHPDHRPRLRRRVRRRPRRDRRRVPRSRHRAPGREPRPGAQRVGPAAAGHGRQAPAAGQGDPQAGGAAPRPPAAAPAARPDQRRAVRAEAVLGDVAADGQPGAAADPAVRRGDLRRGEPDRPRRRDRLDDQGASGGGRGRRQAAAADELLPPGGLRRPGRRRRPRRRGRCRCEPGSSRCSTRCGRCCRPAR